MSLKTELTSADLNEIRQSALGAADPLGIAADLAESVDEGRLADPEDAGYALRIAAEIAESRTKLDAALRYVDRAIEAYGERDDSKAGAVRALRARILFRLGREGEAMAELEPLRPTLTEFPDAGAYISAALAGGGRSRLAEQWLTEAVQSVLADRGEQDAEPGGQLFFLLQLRHRLRHTLGFPHDKHDDLAEKLETRLANAGPKAPEAEELLFFPQAEFGKVLAQWPALSEAYGGNWDEHRARLERQGKAPLRGDAAGLAKFDGPAAYAAQLTTKVSWPPERNAPCWCGSGIKYKKCCLPRGRG